MAIPLAAVGALLSGRKAGEKTTSGVFRGRGMRFAHVRPPMLFASVPRALVAVVALALATAVTGCADADADAEGVESHPDESTETSAMAATLAPATSPLADAVDARCATTFTTADRDAIQAAIRASDLAPADLQTHALNRLGFGDRFAGTALPADVAATFAAKIYTSLRGGGSISATARSAMQAALPTLARPHGDYHFDFRQLYEKRDAARAAGDATTAASLDAQITALRDKTLDELAGKQIMAAALSADIALGELLTSFWLNHFSVEGRKIAIWAPAYEWAIRTNVCGTFGGMLTEVAKTPAMLKFLDNYMSVAPGTTHWTGANDINENYARELLELHTIGTGPKTTTNTTSPYTQTDVERVALILTGWSYTYAADDRSTTFKFFPEYHAKGTKTVMGVTYADGVTGGTTLLTNLASHAKTKRAICGKLAGQFFTSAAPSTVVDACVAAWGSGGELPRMIVAILSRAETWKSTTYANKVKNPFELVVSSHRLSGDDETTLTAARVKAATQAARRMGLWLWRVDEPTGYSSHHLDWLGPGYLDEQARYLYALSDPSGLDYTTSSGAVLRDAALENHFAALADQGVANALTTAQNKVLPTRALPYESAFDVAFLQKAFTSPDLAPSTTAAERPIRTLLTYYGASWQFLLK